MSFVLHSNVVRPTAEVTRSLPHRGHGRYIARLAIDPPTRHDAFRLRYDSYLDQGHINPDPSGLFEDRYDAFDNSRTIVLYDDLGAVGSVRVCLLGRPGLVSPASEAFPVELAPLLSRLPPGTSAAEITRLVRCPAAANEQALVFLLYRLANYVGFVEQVSLLMASVRRNHAVFYRRLGFEVASEPRAYPGLTCRMQLMSCERASYERSFVRFPLIDPFAPGADRLDGLYKGEDVPVSLLPSLD